MGSSPISAINCRAQEKRPPKAGKTESEAAKTDRVYDEAETVFRVYRLSEDLRKKVKAARVKRQQTLKGLIEGAVEQELPALTKQLMALGIKARGASRPARLPVTDHLLDQLRQGSEETGVAATILLGACLSLSSGRKRAKGTRSR